MTLEPVFTGDEIQELKTNVRGIVQLVLPDGTIIIEAYGKGPDGFYSDEPFTMEIDSKTPYKVLKTFA